jgi:hypothetical protein
MAQRYMQEVGFTAKASSLKTFFERAISQLKADQSIARFLVANEKAKQTASRLIRQLIRKSHGHNMVRLHARVLKRLDLRDFIMDLALYCFILASALTIAYLGGLQVVSIMTNELSAMGTKMAQQKTPAFIETAVLRPSLDKGQ